MYDIDRLVQLITDRLLENSQDLKKKVPLYAIVTDDTVKLLEQNGYDVVDDYQLAEKVVVDNLSLDALLRVAALCPTTREETAFLTCLLEGKQVFVSTDVLAIERYKQSSTTNLYRDLLKQKTVLERYGVRYYQEGQLLGKLSSEAARKEAKESIQAKKSSATSSRRLVTESRLRNMGLAEGDTFQLEKGMIITALAKDYLKRHKITIVK